MKTIKYEVCVAECAENRIDSKNGKKEFWIVSGSGFMRKEDNNCIMKMSIYI